MPAAHLQKPKDTTTASPVVVHSVPTSGPVHTPLELTDQTNLLPFRNLIIVYAGLAICVIVSALEAVITATTLPTISAYFHAGSIVSWVPSAYMLTSTSFQPLCGRFSDIFGRKATMCLAMSVFMFGCLMAGFSRSVVELIVWRAVAGVGGGSIRSLAQIITSDVVSLRERGKYQGIIICVTAIGKAIGPLIGGALAEKVSWRWCFWVPLPVSLIAICVVIFCLPLKSVEGDMTRKLLAIDYLGFVLTLLGSTLIVLPIIWGGVMFPWNSPFVLAPLCSGVVVLLIFCYWEWKGARLPIVPMYIFKHVTVVGVYIATFANGFVYFSSLYYLPQFFQVSLGYSPIRSGVFLIPILIAQSFVAWLTGMIISRTGRHRALTYFGFSVWAVACGCLSMITGSTPKALVVFYMVLAGAGSGQTLPTTTVACQASVPRKDVSVVTAVRDFVRQFGSTLSLAIGSTLINNSLRIALNSLSLSPSAIKTIIDNPAFLSPHAPTSQLASVGLGPTQASYALAHGYTQGFKWVFVVNACMASIAAVASILMIKHTELLRGDEEKLKERAKQLLEGEKGEDKSAGAENGERDGNEADDLEAAKSTG